jgi:DUF2892 family protein
MKQTLRHLFDEEAAMTINEGTWDRLIRVVIGAALGYLAWITWPTVMSLVSLVIGLVAFVTGVVGWCALYKVLGVSTNRRVTA